MTVSLVLSTLLIFTVSGCDIMTDSSSPGSGLLPYASMEWLNNLISSWYEVNNEQVHDLVKNILEKELNNVVPDVIEKITLEECTFGTDTPQIKGIKSRVANTTCLQGGKQKKIVIDLILSIDAPDFEFKLGVKVPLVTLRVAVQKLSFLGNLRVTALFSDTVPFPGIQNLCITFTDRPQVGFNVELLNAIDIDTFGVDKIIADIIEDVLAVQLVYPGRLYVDLSGIGTGGKVETIMMPRKSDQHPGVVTTSVRVERLRHSTETAKVEVGIELGSNKTKETVQLMMDEQTVTRNFLIEDFDADELLVRAWESRLIFRDIQYGVMKVDLADMEFSLPSVTQTFQNEEKNVNITVDVKAYLLPLIAIKQDKESVMDYQSRFSGSSCAPDLSLNTGVLYVHIHRATGLPKTDDHSKADPFVTVYYNGNEVLKTKEVTNSNNPVFNEWTEFLTDDHGFLQSNITFKLDDNDVFPNPDDPIGTSSIDLSKDYVRKVNTALVLETRRKDVVNDILLYVSIVFRSAPLV